MLRISEQILSILFIFFVLLCFDLVSANIDKTVVDGMGAMFVGTQKILPKKERGRKEKGEDYIISHLIKSSH